LILAPDVPVARLGAVPVVAFPRVDSVLVVPSPRPPLSCEELPVRALADETVARFADSPLSGACGARDVCAESTALRESTAGVDSGSPDGVGCGQILNII